MSALTGDTGDTGGTGGTSGTGVTGGAKESHALGMFRDEM